MLLLLAGCLTGSACFSSMIGAQIVLGSLGCGGAIESVMGKVPDAATADPTSGCGFCEGLVLGTHRC